MYWIHIMIENGKGTGKKLVAHIGSCKKSCFDIMPLMLFGKLLGVLACRNTAHYSLLCVYRTCIRTHRVKGIVMKEMPGVLASCPLFQERHTTEYSDPVGEDCPPSSYIDRSKEALKQEIRALSFAVESSYPMIVRHRTELYYVLNNGW